MSWKLGYDLALESAYALESDMLSAYEEINRAEGEYQEEMEPVNERLREVERLKAQITDEGVSQEIATRIGELAGDENIHEKYGVTIESFSRYPSRTNANIALEELNDTAKGAAYGAAAVIGLAIIAKLVHMIWKFFKKDDDGSGSKNSGDDIKNSREDFARRRQRIDEIEKEIKEATKHSDELKQIYEEMEEELENSKNQLGEYLDDHWNGLMNAILVSTDNQFNASVIKVFNDFPNYTKAVGSAVDTCSKINSSLSTWVSQGNAKDEVGRLLDELTKNLPPEHMRKNLEEIQGLVDQANGLRAQKESVNRNTITNISNDISTNSGLTFLLNLEKFKPMENSNLATKDGGGRAGEVADSLRATIKDLGSKIDKETTAELNEFISYYMNGTKAYAKTLLLFQMIKASYDLFMAALKKHDINARGGIFRRIISKFMGNGKSAEEIRRMPNGQVLQKFLNDVKSGDLSLNTV